MQVQKNYLVKSQPECLHNPTVLGTTLLQRIGYSAKEIRIVIEIR